MISINGITVEKISTTTGKRVYRLLEPYSFSFQGKTITIPSGFIFDGATIPRIFWKLIGHPLERRFIEPTLVHDYLCANKFPRQPSDAIFKQLLKKVGVSYLKRTAMYLAVRLYGRVKGYK